MSDPLSRIDKRLEEALGAPAVGPNAALQNNADKVAKAREKAAKKEAQAAEYRKRNERDEWRRGQQVQTGQEEGLPPELIQALEKLTDGK